MQSHVLCHTTQGCCVSTLFKIALANFFSLVINRLRSLDDAAIHLHIKSYTLGLTFSFNFCKRILFFYVVYVCYVLTFFLFFSRTFFTSMDFTYFIFQYILAYRFHSGCSLKIKLTLKLMTKKSVPSLSR